MQLAYISNEGNIKVLGEAIRTVDRKISHLHVISDTYHLVDLGIRQQPYSVLV